MVEVKFVNKSGERVSIYREDGSVLKILENAKCWDRNPASGTLRTSVISQHEKPPPPQPNPFWINEVEWVWEDCPDNSIYAPFKKITFLDGNKVRLKKRLFWRLPELSFPIVTFLYEGKMKFIRERLQGEHSPLASIFHNGIPVRKSVSALSKYAEYKRWFFLEQPMRQASPKQIASSEIVQFGEGRRSANEEFELSILKVEVQVREMEKFV